MRAAVFQGPGLLHKIEDIPMPSPSARQVLIQVERCGICGSDITMGKARAGPNPLGEAYDAIFAPGKVLGHEISGCVVGVGKDVERLKVGDRIAPMAISGCATCAGCLSGNPLWCSGADMLMGGYGQFALANEYHSALLPPELSMESGALIEPMATSLHAVALSEMKPNSRIIVLGAGALGLGIVHFARRAGAGMIAAVARSPARESLALAVGADIYKTQSCTLAEELADIMGGPADIVFEAAGAPGLIAQGIQCVGPNGKIVTAGICSEPESNFHIAAITKQVKIQYSTAYTLDEFEVVVRLLRDPINPLNLLVSQTTSLEDFPAVFDALCKGGAHTKVLVNPLGT